jgi:hypothetical protein
MADGRIKQIDDRVETDSFSFQEWSRPSAIGHRSPLIGHRSSVIGHRSSAIGHRPSLIGQRSPAIGHRNELDAFILTKRR